MNLLPADVVCRVFIQVGAVVMREEMNENVSEGVPVTYVLITYNQEGYVRDSVAAAFAQVYSPMEIIISDDASSDGTFAIIQEMVEAYRGPHRIRTWQNPINLGVVGNVNKVLELIETDLFVVAAGDDVSMPNRTAALVDLFQKTGCSAAYSAADKIGDDGRVVGTFGCFDADFLKAEGLVCKMPPFYGAGAAYSIEIIKRHGLVPCDIRNEDMNLMWKAYFSNGIAYTKERLLKYRIHGGNLSIDVKVDNAASTVVAKRYKLEKYENFIKNYKHILKIAGIRGIPYLCYLILNAQVRKMKIVLGA